MFWRAEVGRPSIWTGNVEWPMSSLSDERGRSRWFGEGQMLSHKVCQSIRRILSSDDTRSCWSQRASQQLVELRREFPWLSPDATVLLRKTNGSIQWWTFAGGVANTLLADALKSTCDVNGDNFCLRFSAPSSEEVIGEAIDRLSPTTIAAVPSTEAMENLKFSECLSPEIAAGVFSARFNDQPAVKQALGEPRRIVLEDES